LHIGKSTVYVEIFVELVAEELGSQDIFFLIIVRECERDVAMHR
jgi:hypothetical protein